MKLTRKDLIKICDQFLNDEIAKFDVENFACEAIFDDDLDWNDDDIISKTIFEWNNETINFEINKTNIRLWKNRLITEKDELMSYNFWNSHIEKQKEICTTHNSTWKPINKKLNIGASTNLDIDPINGLRHPSEKGTTGWFIWTGEYSEADNFFHPICAEHLLQKRPDIIKYLGLEIGFRFLVNRNGYEDIWYDDKLKNI